MEGGTREGTYNPEHATVFVPIKQQTIVNKDEAKPLYVKFKFRGTDGSLARQRALWYCIITCETKRSFCRFLLFQTQFGRCRE